MKKNKNITIFKSFILNFINSIFDFMIKHHFGIDMIIAIGLVVIYFVSENPGFNGENITKGQENFLFYSYSFFVLFFVFNAFELLIFKHKINRLKNDLKLEGFKKYIEYQYHKNDEGFFNGVGFIITLLISFITIGFSLMGMQFSYDIANIKDGKILLDGTSEFSSLFGGWLGVLIVVFILYFLGFKFHKLAKRDFIEREFLSNYLKKNKKL